MPPSSFAVIPSRRQLNSAVALTVLVWTACRSAPAAAPVPAAGQIAERAGCFALEHLPLDEQRFSREALLRMSDGEGLYTAAGGLKPISSDIVRLRIPVSPRVGRAQMDSLELLQRLRESLQCRDVAIDVQLYTSLHPGRDSTERVLTAGLFVSHRRSLREAIARHAAFFATIGITPDTDPALVMARTDAAPRAPRWRAYGYLFGYPDDAVDFFVDAGLRGDSSGRVEPRDFRRIDTWRRFPERENGPPVLSTFVYAVPAGSAGSAADSVLRQMAAPVYADYQRRRARWVTSERNEIGELWREWIGGGH